MPASTPRPDDTPTAPRPTSLDPVDVARVVNVAWSVTRDRIAYERWVERERERRIRADWSGYFLDPSRIEQP